MGNSVKIVFIWNCLFNWNKTLKEKSVAFILYKILANDPICQTYWTSISAKCFGIIKDCSLFFRNTLGDSSVTSTYKWIENSFIVAKWCDVKISAHIMSLISKCRLNNHAEKVIWFLPSKDHAVKIVYESYLG